MEKIGVYIRVSSNGQKTDGQRADIIRWLDAHGHNIQAVQWFEDTETGAHTSRPAFIQLSEAIFSGDVKTVIVWKLDRIARNMQDGIKTLSAWCESGVRVVSVTQQIDLSGSVGQLVAGVLFGIAQIEREYIRERQAVGIAAAKARGIYKGGKKGTTKAKPERARVLRQQGLKVDEIAQAMNTSSRTIFRYLKG